MKETLMDLLGSKKFLASAGAFFAYLIIRVAGHYGLAIDEATANQIGDRLVGLAMVYVGGQALADHGKEAELVKQDATPVPNVTKLIAEFPKEGK